MKSAYVVVKKAYINGLGCVSPQSTFDNRLFLNEPVSVESNRLKALDPNYKDFVPPEMVRRMGRIIKMGVAAAKICLADAGYRMPDKIITGTGLGCIEDTEKFLGNMIRNKEEFLTPTSFIQSTHNTVSAQIALLIKCHGYNFTYVHRGFSFETAMFDSLMQISSGNAKTLLLGCADELTNNSFQIQYRLGLWKRKPVNNLQLYVDKTRGTIAGEGASFFLLETEKSPSAYATLQDCSMLFQPEHREEIYGWIWGFLKENQLETGDIDLFLCGMNGDPKGDQIYQDVISSLFQDVPIAFFKHLCGEYHTATGFATWLAAKALREQVVPAAAFPSRKPNALRTILIYNHHRGINHSLILLNQA
ncbi:MAG: beta-ketoacyl synthase N-terminal-like domain-containing protein [bacterium]